MKTVRDSYPGRPISPMTLPCVIQTVVMVFLFGCQEPMTAISEIDKLRIMAVQTEPPDIRPGETTVHRLLYADPHGEGRGVTALWFSVLTDTPPPEGTDTSTVQDAGVDAGGPDMPSSSGEMMGLLGMPQQLPATEPYAVTIPQDLKVPPPDAEEAAKANSGDDESAKTYLSATTFVILCAGGTIDQAAFMSLLFSEVESSSMQSPFIVVAENQEKICTGQEMQIASKMFRISEHDDANRNTNPVIRWVKFDGTLLNAVDDSASNTRADSVGIFNCTSTDQCLMGAKISAKMTDASSETYDLMQLEELTNVGEDPYISWFATGGIFNRNRSRAIQSNKTFNTTWAPPIRGGTFTLWAVAHDLRGGISWKQYALKANTAE